MTLTYSLGSVGTGIHPNRSITYHNAYIFYAPIDITIRPGSNNTFNTNIIWNNHHDHEHLVVLLDNDIIIQGITLLTNIFTSITNDEMKLPLFNNTNANIVIPKGTVFGEVISVNNISNEIITLYDYNLYLEREEEDTYLLLLAGVGNLLVRTYGDSNFNGRISNYEYLPSIELVRYDSQNHITNYGIEIIGYIYPTYTETYTFYITSNEKIRFWVNNELLLHDWTTTVDTEQTSATIDLIADKYYPIYIQQAEIAGDNQVLSVQWESTSQTKEILPSEKLATNEHQDSTFENKLQVADNIQIFNSTTETQQLMKLSVNTTGDLQFSYNGTDIGSISAPVEPSLLNLTGQHMSFTNNTSINTTPADYIGYIVSTTGEYKNLNDSLLTVDNATPIIDLTSIDNDKKVFGIISSRESESSDRTFQYGILSNSITKNVGDERLFINSIGEGMVWICDKGGNLTNGDLITTSTAIGFGQLQADDLVHNYTVGKITQDCDFDTLTIIRWVDLTGNIIDETTYNLDTLLGHRCYFVGCVYYCG